MVEVAPLALDMLVLFSERLDRLAATLDALLAAGDPALGPPELPLGTAGVAGIGWGRARRLPGPGTP